MSSILKEKRQLNRRQMEKVRLCNGRNLKLDVFHLKNNAPVLPLAAVPLLPYRSQIRRGRADSAFVIFTSFCKSLVLSSTSFMFGGRINRRTEVYSPP